jgi:hypothetical protein
MNEQKKFVHTPPLEKPVFFTPKFSKKKKNIKFVGMRKQTHNRWQHKQEWWQHTLESSRPSTLTVQCSPLSLSLFSVC